MSAREFLRWRLYLIGEENYEFEQPDKDEHYLARLSYEVYLLRMTVIGMFSKKAKIELLPRDFLIPAPKKEKIKKKKSIYSSPQEELEARKTEATIEAQKVWFAAVGYTGPT